MQKIIIIFKIMPKLVSPHHIPCGWLDGGEGRLLKHIESEIIILAVLT